VNECKPLPATMTSGRSMGRARMGSLMPDRSALVLYWLWSVASAAAS